MRNKKISKLLALAVFMGGVTCGSSVWATPPISPENTVFIYALSASEFNGAYPTGVSASNLGTSGGGIISGNWGTSVNKIVSYGSVVGDVIAAEGGVFGIKTGGASSVIATSISGGIEVGGSKGDVCAIYFEGSGDSTISGLGDIKVKAIDGAKAHGIYAKDGTTGVNTVTFKDDESVITIDKADNFSKFGIYLKGGTNYIGTNASEETGGELDSIEVGGTGGGPGYGIAIGDGKNTIAFTGSSSSITITGSGKSYGIGFLVEGMLGPAAAFGTTTIKDIGSISAISTGSGLAYGIYAKNGNDPIGSEKFSVSFDTFDGTISAYSSSGVNCGIFFEPASPGKSEVLNVKTIKAGVNPNNLDDISLGDAYGIRAAFGVNTVAFTGTGSSIVAKSSGNSAYGISLTCGTNTISGLGGITAEAIVISGAPNAYGISILDGTNDITFSGTGSFIVANANSGDSYGISFGSGGTAATGTTKITGLGSIVSDPLTVKNAYGIYVNNGNSAGASDPVTFRVEFVKNRIATDGVIKAYSEDGANYGIKFDDNCIGKSEVLNVKTIVAGVDPNNSNNISAGNAYGIHIGNGVNTVTFSGWSSSIEAKSSGYGTTAMGIYLENGTNYIGTDNNELGNITVKSTGTDDSSVAYGINVYDGENTIKFSGAGSSIMATCSGDAVGILLANGNTTITGLGSIAVTSTGGDTYGIYTAEGTNEISFKGNGGQAIKSTVGAGGEAYGICVTAEADYGYIANNDTIVNFENTILSGKIHQKVAGNGGTENSTLTLNFNNGGVWTPKTDDVTGTVTVNVNSGGRIVFDLPAATVAGDTILEMDGTVDIKDGSTIQVINGKATALKEGDVICLLDNSDPISLGTNVAKQHSSDGIVWSEAEIYLNDTDNTQLMYQKTKMGLEPDGSKAPVEGMAAANASVNTSTDLALGAGMSNLIASTAAVVNNTETFGAASYGKSRLNSGSHVDTRGYGIVVGAGKKVFNKAGNKTTGGIFFEYGNSDFDTYNHAVTGTGKSINKGLGYMMRYDHTCGNYYEGMLHGGKVATNWSQNGSTDAYDMSPTYFGGALTYGHKFMVEQERQLSVYGSYIYTRTGGGDAKIGEHNYSFGTTNSHRTRMGIRYTMSDLMDTKKFRPYAGLAWEHEFNGETTATVRGFGDAPSPSMKGDSGILEFGCKQEVGKWTLGIGVEAFAGKRRGWNGTLQATYNF